jgi:uncharacterized protein (DUF58 family)
MRTALGLVLLLAAPFAASAGWRMASHGHAAAEREMTRPQTESVDLTTASAGAARLSVSRRPRGRADRRRAYAVEIDGSAVAAVRVGETVELVLAPGVHAVRMRVDWCSSRTLELELHDGDRAGVECRARRASPLLLVWMTIGFPRYIGLRRTAPAVNPGR